MKSKKFFRYPAVLIFMLVFSINMYSTDATSDASILKTDDILTFGIESEIVSLLKDLGTSPRTDLYVKLLNRYKEAISNDTKISFIDYFSDCKNLPQNITDTLYNDASSDYLDKRVESSLILCLGKVGKKREGEFLIKKLDTDDSIIKSVVSDAISRMKVPELANQLIKRLEDSDTVEEKYIEPEIKSKLVLYFGENKSKEAVPYLQKIISDKSSNKYMIMYGMISLLKIGDISSLKLIASNLANDDPKIQEYAAYSISLFKNKETLPYLKKMLLHNNENIRAFACQGLALNEDNGSIQILLYKFKNDPSFKVRNEASIALINIGSGGITALKDAMKGGKLPESILAGISSAIAKTPTDAGVEYLMNIFKSGEKKEKDIIVGNMSGVVSNKADPLISLFLNSSDNFHRINGIKIVSQIENTTLWAKVSDLAGNDPVSLVKNTAKKYLDIKK